MASIVRFVNGVLDSPTTLLDLNTAPLMVGVEGVDLSPPDLRRTQVQTFIGNDGDVVTDTAPENRVVKIPLKMVRTTTAEQAATVVANLHSQLAKDNILMIQLDGMTKPVFYLTYAAPDYSMKMLRLLLNAATGFELEIMAQPYGVGPKVTLSTRTMYNSWATGPLASINGDFETNATGWSVETGGSTFARSTAQFHAGAASGLVTPDGTTATVRVRLTTAEAATPGQEWRVRGWLRCDVARTVNLDLGFFNSGGSLIGSWTQRGYSVNATTWTYLDISATAPANTTGVRIGFSMGSTPAASHKLYVDELKLQRRHVDGSLYTDITGILGDTDTPLFLQIADNFGTSNAGRKQSLLAMRKGGTPSNVPFIMESENMESGTDVSFLLDVNDSDTTNGDYIAITYGTVQTLTRRLFITAWPISWSSDLRGRYDVYARVRIGGTNAVHQVQLRYGNSSSLFSGDLITLPPGDATTNWFYVYLGTIAFPTGYDPVTEGYSGTPIEAAQMYIELATARVSGSSGLDIDTMNFIPADDETCLITWPPYNTATNYILDGRRTAVYGIDGSGRSMPIGAVAIAGAVPMLRPGASHRLFWYRDVGAGADSTRALGTGDHSDETTTITPYYYPRYWMVRQATT